jgi:cell division transport system permease protein
MHLRYVFSELGQGLRRNLSMHVAVVLTLFVSLSLAGGGLLLQREADLIAEHLGDELKIKVDLCTNINPTDNPNCADGDVTEEQRAQIEHAFEESPDVASHSFVTKREGYDMAKELYSEEFFSGDNPIITVDNWPAGYWVTLDDPEEADDVISAVIGLDGVAGIQDHRDTLAKIYRIMDALRYGALVGSVILLLAALLLVANTIRLAALARRREIGIMRLVGASTMYIALPFLLEALVTALIGMALAAGALAAFVQFAVGRVDDAIRFTPWIGWEEYVQSLIGYLPPGIFILAPVLTVVPTLLLTRKYIKV